MDRRALRRRQDGGCWMRILRRTGRADMPALRGHVAIATRTTRRGGVTKTMGARGNHYHPAASPMTDALLCDLAEAARQLGGIGPRTVRRPAPGLTCPWANWPCNPTTAPKKLTAFDAWEDNGVCSKERWEQWVNHVRKVGAPLNHGSAVMHFQEFCRHDAEGYNCNTLIKEITERYPWKFPYIPNDWKRNS